MEEMDVYIEDGVIKYVLFFEYFFFGTSEGEGEEESELYRI